MAMKKFNEQQLDTSIVSVFVMSVLQPNKINTFEILPEQLIHARRDLQEAKKVL